MSSTSASTKKSGEQAVLSRRLRPIYDAIDAGCNKKAVQEADKVLKKHPSTPAAKALKALAYIRLERRTDARPLMAELEALVDGGNFDENLLQSICHCYKEAYEPERIVSLYESVSRQCVGDEQYATHLFMAYVRVRNYKLQQKVAMQLYKEHSGNTPYYMWAVMSVVMQALEDNRLGTSMFFPLAERMLDKIAGTHNFQTEEVDLHLMVLEARGKYTEALEALERDPSACVGAVAGTKMRHRANELYSLAGEHNVVVARAICSLESDYDDWDTWSYLFNSGLQVVGKGNGGGGGGEEERDEGQRMLERLVEVCLRAIGMSDENGDPILKRGPYMARLELISRLQSTTHSRNPSVLRLGSALEGLKSIVMFSHYKSYCFSDLRGYLHLLTNEVDQHQLVDPISTRNHSIWGEILKERVQIAFNSPNIDGNGDEKIVWKRVIQIFRKIPKERQASGQEVSAYAQIITQLVWALYIGTGKKSWLFTLILLLEYVESEYSQCSAYVPLVLCRLYRIVGGVDRVRELCKLMDIKYIQRDSLGYLQFSLAEQYGQFKPAILYHTSMTSLYDQNEREIAECTVNAYKSGQFSQIPKLVELGRRCASSVFAVGADVMNRSLSACFAIQSAEVAAQTLVGDSEGIELLSFSDWEKLSDNRDFTLLAPVSSKPRSVEMEELKLLQRESLEELIAYLKLRHLLCKAIGLLWQGNGSPTSLDNFQSAFQAFRAHLDQCKLIYSGVSRMNNYLQPFAHVNIAAQLLNGFYDLPLLVLSISQSMLLNAHGSSPNGDESVSPPLLLEKLKKQLQRVVSTCQPYPTTTNDFTSISSTIEKCASAIDMAILSHMALKLVGSFHAGRKSSMSSSKNPRKTKDPMSSDKPPEDYRKCFIASLAPIEATLLDLANRLKVGKEDIGKTTELLIPSNHHRMADLLKDERDQRKLKALEERVSASLRKSHTTSVEEMLHALRSRMGGDDPQGLSKKLADVSLSSTSQSAV